MVKPKTHKILFVCLGNICRSPTAEGVFKKLASQQPLNKLEIDSCGTIGYHAGSPPDARAAEFAKRRGYDLSAIRSRKITEGDLAYFDYILAMDDDNLSELQDLAGGNDALSKKCCLFLDFANSTNTRCVPDPYYGGASGFDTVIDLIEEASRGLINHLAGRSIIS